MCLTFDVSSSCQSMAFGDSDGSIHLFTTNPEAVCNTYSRETTFAEPLETLTPININDAMTPLSTVALPYCQGRLASDWPEDLLRKAYRYIYKSMN
jgi:PAB-dependent poly(A)-specific ribonuclease subunit 2